MSPGVMEIFKFAFKVAPYLMKARDGGIFSLIAGDAPPTGSSSHVASAMGQALQTVKDKKGSVTVLLGTRSTGKSELAYRLAEFYARPTFAVSPEQRPPAWIRPIGLGDIDKVVPPRSTLILDDLPVYASNRDYNNQLVQALERIIPMVRHRRQLHLIFCSQNSAQADKCILDCDLAFLKPLGILCQDVERPFIRRVYKEDVDPEFEGKGESWIVRHAFMMSRTYKGIVEIARAR